MTDRPTIAFLGLGVMGGPVAGHLLRAGFPVAAYNRTGARAVSMRTGVGTPSARRARHVLPPLRLKLRAGLTLSSAASAMMMILPK